MIFIYITPQMSPRSCRSLVSVIHPTNQLNSSTFYCSHAQQYGQRLLSSRVVISVLVLGQIVGLWVSRTQSAKVLWLIVMELYMAKLDDICSPCLTGKQSRKHKINMFYNETIITCNSLYWWCQHSETKLSMFSRTLSPPSNNQPSRFLSFLPAPY
jgi:hypothetical protein